MRKNIFAVINEKINASKITKNKIAKFTLPNDAQGMNDQMPDDVDGTWSIEDSSLYSSSGNTLIILTAGVYEVSIHFHGLLNVGTYVEEVAVASGYGGIVHSQAVGLSGAAVQGYTNASKVLYMNAGTTLKLQAYTSSPSNYIYGSGLSSNNSVVVTKLS